MKTYLDKVIQVAMTFTIIIFFKLFFVILFINSLINVKVVIPCEDQLESVPSTFKHHIKAI